MGLKLHEGRAIFKSLLEMTSTLPKERHLVWKQDSTRYCILQQQERLTTSLVYAPMIAHNLFLNSQVDCTWCIE